MRFFGNTASRFFLLLYIPKSNKASLWKWLMIQFPGLCLPLLYAPYVNDFYLISFQSAFWSVVQSLFWNHQLQMKLFSEV